MAKHKQSKRERKFNAKGGVKARLEKGHTIAPKGKVLKRKRRGGGGGNNAGGGEEQNTNNNKRNKKSTISYFQQQEAQRESEDFVGSANLGDMDIGSFLANLEEDLLKQQDEEEEDSVVSMNDDDSDDDDDEKKVVKASSSSANKGRASTNPKTKKSNDSDSDDDSSDSDSDDESDDDEKPETKKSTSTTKTTLKKDASKQKKKTTKKKDDDENDSDDDESSSDSDDSDDDDIEAVEARMKAQMKKLQSQDPEFHEYLQENEQSLLEFGANDENDASDDDDDDDESDSDSEGEDDDEKKPTSSKNKKEKKSKDDEDEKKEPDGSRSIELTPKMLRNLEHGAFQAHGIKSLKKLVRAYKAACQVAANAGDEDDDEQEDEEEGGNSRRRRGRRLQEKTFHIESSEVFDRLMVSCLGQCHEAFYFHLLATDDEREAKLQQQKDSKTGADKEEEEEEDNTKKSKSKKKKKTKPKSKEQGKNEGGDDRDGGDEKKGEEEEESDDAPLDPKILERSPRWLEVKPILNTFLKATQQLITESKEPDLLAIVLKSMSKYIRYLTPFPKMAESLLRKLVGLWSAPLGDASPDYQVVRLNSFLRIRQLALTQPFPFVELCLKKTYLAYARRAKYGGTGSVMTNALPTLTFMGNCIVELYSLDHQSSYQHAFVYIRQLALYLRTVMQKKTTESMQQVYCWQFMHCLKLWVAVLSAACKQARDVTDNNNHNSSNDQLMRSLVYPLTEIIMGTVRMAPAPTRHVPLRFHCIRLLQQLAAAAEMFIPTTSLLLEILDLKEFTAKPKKIKSKGGGATTRGVQLPFLIKLSKDDPLRTAEEQEACMAEIFKLLNREVDLYRFSAGFPEYSMQITQRLKKFVKTTKNSRWRAYARGSIDLSKRNTDFAINARSNLSEAPKDVKQLECLRQAKDPSMSERYDVAVEKENKEWTSLIAASTTASTTEKKKQKKKGASKDVDSESDDDDEEEEDLEEEEIVKPKKKATKNKKAKQPLKLPPAAKVDNVVMEIADTVKEGIDWSDDED